MEARVYKSRDVRERRRHGSTKLWEDIKRGVLTPPVKRGPRDNVWPAGEIDELIRAELRGDSADARRELVKRLLEARKSA